MSIIKNKIGSIIYFVGICSFILAVCFAAHIEDERVANEGYTIVLPSDLDSIQDLHVVKNGKIITITEAPKHKPLGYQIYCINDSTIGLFDSSRFVGSFDALDVPVLNNLIMIDNE